MNKKYSLEIGREEKKHYLYVVFCKLRKPSEIYLKRQKVYIKNTSYKINFRSVAFELYK